MTGATYFQPESEHRVGHHVEYEWARLRIRTWTSRGGHVKVQNKTFFRESVNREPRRDTWTVGLQLGRWTLGGKTSHELLP